MSLTFRSPASQPQTNSPSLPLNPFLEDKGHNRVLIVDDEMSIRTLFAHCLSARYTCATAASVEEALVYLAENEFALVITDVIMPGLSGVELLRKVVSGYPDTAVIVASGVDRTQRALDALRLGASDYLIKPCDMDVLELSVERALERRLLIRDARRYKQDLEARNAELVRRKVELERLQAQIIHSEKMASLGQLAAGVAHELNNPVGFIYGNLDILNQNVIGLAKLLNYYDTVTLPPDASTRVASIKDEIDYEASLEDLGLIIADCRNGAERIRDIVQNLRTFSRLDETGFTKSDIHEGIESTARLLSRYYSADNITLTRDYGELPLIDAHAGQLNQVWMNLLVNAAQAVSKTGGEVRIITRVQDESVVIAISDTGCGIPAEHFNRIFDPFFTTKPVGEGTGLGLSISFGIVERHRGTINLESHPNQGTTFTVTLPIINNSPQPTDEIE